MSTSQQPESADEQRENEEDAAERELSGQTEAERQYDLNAPVRKQRELDYQNALVAEFRFSITPRYDQCLIQSAYLGKLGKRRVLIPEVLLGFAAKDNEADQEQLLLLKAQAKAQGRKCEVVSCSPLYSALAEIAERGDSQIVLSFWMEYHGFTLLNKLRRKQPEGERELENNSIGPMMELYWRDQMFMLFHHYAEDWGNRRRGERENDPDLAAKRAIANQATVGKRR
jgi:hypothetical protein